MTEAEFYAEVRGCVEGLYVKNMMEFWWHHVTMELQSDNSAARTIMNRLGAGKKTRHVSTKFFWVQRLCKDGLLKVVAIAGTENEADIGTKYLATSAEYQSILERIGVSFPEGKSAIARAAAV